jgi:hypothetical protein
MLSIAAYNSWERCGKWHTNQRKSSMYIEYGDNHMNYPKNLNRRHIKQIRHDKLIQIKTTLCTKLDTSKVQPMCNVYIYTQRNIRIYTQKHPRIPQGMQTYLLKTA